MDEERLRELIERLRAFERDARELEELLLYLRIEAPPLTNFEGILELLRFLERQQGLYQALARVDFADDHYTFLRAIDGDTIVVEPPRALQRWLKDIHVRLYGLETPELWEDMGPKYRQHLEELCAVDANRRLMIVWERERPHTSYPGFPLSSFERGIGNVFFRGAEGKYCYINGLMHALKYSSLHRDGRNLLRGRRVVENIDLQLSWAGPCATELEAEQNEPSATFTQISEMHPPVCLLTYPKLPTLDPRDESFEARVLDVILQAWQLPCPFASDLIRHSKAVLQSIVAQKASPFDIPLVEISMWAMARHGQTA